MWPDRLRPILKVFSEARAWGRGGEVVVRSGADTGRVFFVKGRIAWVTVSSSRGNFLAYIVERSDLTRGQLQQVFEACKQTGQNFAEAIVERGLLSEEVLRRLLLQHLSECLFEILCWLNVEAMFVPEERSYQGRLTFELEEVLQSVIDLDTRGRLLFGGASAAEILSQASPDSAAATAGGGPDGEPTTSGDPLGELLGDLGATHDTLRDDGPPAGQSPPALSGRETRRASRQRWGWPRVLLLSAGAALVTAGAVALLVHSLRHAPPAKPAVNPAPPPTGQVRIASTPPGARVFLDGVASGVTPARIDRVEPGRKYALRVTLDGWQAWETRFVLTNTARPLEFEALLRKAAPVPADPARAGAPRTRHPRSDSRKPETLPVVSPDEKGKGAGHIQVTSRPPRAEIYLDGVRTGKRTPATLRRIPAGLLHVVQLSLPGRAPSQATVRLARNKISRLKLVLGKKDSEEPAAAPVSLDSAPRGAVVLVDGKQLEQITPVTITLTPGKPCRLEVRRKGYRSWKRVISPLQGMRLALTARIMKKR